MWAYDNFVMLCLCFFLVLVGSFMESSDSTATMVVSSGRGVKSRGKAKAG